MDLSKTQLIESVFAGSGEMRERMRELDWSTTALGPLEQWSRSLRISVRIVLSSGYPMTIYWGPDYTMLYNDACRQVMGTKHPAALGRGFREAFPEMWDSVGPLLDRVMTQGQDVSTLTDQLFLLNRNGYLEECYFATSFSPIPDDTGGVGGVLNTALETTERVIEDRRRQLLRDLASRAGQARTEGVVWRVSEKTLSEHCLSVPFALLYAYRPAEGRAHLAGTSVEVSSWDPAVIDCTNQNPWRFDAALPLEGVAVELGPRVLALPKSTWPMPVESAAVVPIRLREDGDTVGFLVLGIHPGRAFDDTYRHFVRRLAEQIAIGLVSARAYEQEHQRASERNLAAIINTIPTAAWTTRPDGYCDFINQVWLDYAGMSAEQTQGWGWAEAIHSDDRKRLIDEWQSCLVSGSPVDTEARIRRFDGSHRWFLIRANPLRDESGNILKWCGTCMDIEDRKQGEEDLRARELSWREIVDSIPGLVATTGAMGEVEFLNRQTLEYFGKTNDELKDWALIGAVHPDDLPHVVEAHKKSIEAGQIYEVEHRCRRADGVYRWFQVRGLPVRDTDNNVTAWYLLLTDIDDRKKAEDALHSNERNLSLIINTMPTFAWSARPDGSVEFLNQRWLDYTGLSPEQALDWKWTAAIHPDDLNNLTDYWRSIIVTGEPGEIEARLRRFDGQYRWFLIRASAVHDESGTIVKWYGTHTDIEDRKRAEEALSQSEERARLMVDSIDGQIMTATPKGEVEFVNQQVLDYFGKSLDELKDWRTNNAIHPDDFPRAVALWMHSVETGEPYHFEERLRRADGAYRWFRVRGRCLRDAQGHIGRWYVLLTDIDEGKRAEAQVEQAYLRLAEAQRLSKTGSFITDLVADDHNWSEETFRIFEFDPTTKVTVQRIRDLIHAEDLPSFDAMIARAITGGDVDFVFRILTSRGVVKHIRGMARVIEQAEGRPLFIGALQDVTESKVAEEALNRARSELAHVARVTTLNALTASIAHEINQPLASLITNASICLRRLNADPPNVDGARETAMRTIRDGNRAGDVITRLRALYSKKEFTPEPLDLNEATREVIALSLSDLQRNSVILRSEFADDLPLVTGDRIQLQQVILNLVRNASEAMGSVEDRPRELLISTEQEGADRVRLSVKDSGIGFTREVADKLFQAFYTTKNDGMGIGLHVSRSIIEAHHGRLWATANDGPGATFSFAIPCEQKGSD